MITTTWTSAPAGFLRAGSTDVRYGTCAPAVAPVQGTGLPVAAAVPGAGAGATRLLGTPMTHEFGITNGTTLGYPSPGRPTS